MASAVTLTERQQEVLRAIVAFMENAGYPPTRADIQRAFKFKSQNAVTEHLNALVRKGAIEVVPGVARGIRVLG